MFLLEFGGRKWCLSSLRSSRIAGKGLVCIESQWSEI